MKLGNCGKSACRVPARACRVSGRPASGMAVFKNRSGARLRYVRTGLRRPWPRSDCHATAIAPTGEGRPAHESHHAQFSTGKKRTHPRHLHCPERYYSCIMNTGISSRAFNAGGSSPPKREGDGELTCPTRKIGFRPATRCIQPCARLAGIRCPAACPS